MKKPRSGPPGKAGAKAFAITHGQASVRREVAVADVLRAEPAIDESLAMVVANDESDPAVENWLPGGSLPVTVVEDDAGWEIHWVPGRALIISAEKFQEQLIAAVVAIDASDRKLRIIDTEMAPIEAVASHDVDFAYTIHFKDRSRWKRFDQTIKSLYRHRLELAKFDPLKLMTLTRLSRRAINRFSARLRFDDRAEILSDRLEAVEDLYEGAVDRIIDHRWYMIGITVEVVIVVLLVIEAVLLTMS